VRKPHSPQLRCHTAATVLSNDSRITKGTIKRSEAQSPWNTSTKYQAPMASRAEAWQHRRPIARAYNTSGERLYVGTQPEIQNQLILDK